MKTTDQDLKTLRAVVESDLSNGQGSVAMTSLSSSFLIEILDDFQELREWDARHKEMNRTLANANADRHDDIVKLGNVLTHAKKIVKAITPMTHECPSVAKCPICPIEIECDLFVHALGEFKPKVAVTANSLSH